MTGAAAFGVLGRRVLNLPSSCLVPLAGLLALALAAASGCASASPSGAADAGVDEPVGIAPLEPTDAALAPDATPGPDSGDPFLDASPPPNGTAGCLRASKTGVFEGKTLSVAGVSRGYTLFVPEGYDARKAYRLVVGFHSGGRTGASARPYFGLEEPAAGQAVFVYPDAVGGNWDLATAYPQNRDIAYFDALVAELGGSLCLDKTRVFGVGTSSGAYFVNQLACARGNVLRAIASHAGGGPFASSGGTYDAKGQLICPTPPVAAAIFHGLADTNVSPSEGDKAITHWSHWNGCGAERTPTAPSPCEMPTGCAKPVMVCKVPGQGHAIWAPGRQATWAFFAGF